MTVYVDGMRNYNRRIGRAGPYWSHLLADTPEELHEFAARIGLRREWFQGDHYDIGSWPIYKRAIVLGAVNLSEGPTDIWLDTLRRIHLAFKQDRS